jgi:hypothetical protein
MRPENLIFIVPKRRDECLVAIRTAHERFVVQQNPSPLVLRAPLTTSVPLTTVPLDIDDSPEEATATNSTTVKRRGCMDCVIV